MIAQFAIDLAIGATVAFLLECAIVWLVPVERDE